MGFNLGFKGLKLKRLCNIVFVGKNIYRVTSLTGS
jgi:hypothetical protein